MSTRCHFLPFIVVNYSGILSANTLGRCSRLNDDPIMITPNGICFAADGGSR